MEELRLYHGSTERNLVPEYGKGSSYCDYGKGFYCTEDLEMAKEWACRFEEPGYAYEYILNTNGLKTLNLDQKPYNVLHGLTALMQNRGFQFNRDYQDAAQAYLYPKFSIDLSGYDVITGCRADDSLYDFCSGFLSNRITLETFKKCLTLGDFGKHIVLKSEKAFEQIRYVTRHEADPGVYYPEYNDRNLKANSNLFKLEHDQDIMSGTLFVQIMRENWEVDDARLF